MSSLPDTSPAPKGAKTDKQVAMNETYMFDEQSKYEEAQETMDELDAFEARLRGEAAPSSRAVSITRPVVPSSSSAARKSASTGVKKAGSEYVAAAVRTNRSEEEQEAEDARRAVRDIDRFDGPDSP